MQEKEYLAHLEKRIENRQSLIKQYIQEDSKDERELNFISRAIINLYKSKNQNPSIDRHCLDECHQMVMSASKPLILKLQNSIVPQLLDYRKQKSLLLGYLKAWTVMLTGKNQCAIYPNFGQKYGHLVSHVDIPAHLKQALPQFQSNVKSSNQVIQFFEDSLSSVYDTNRQQIHNPKTNTIDYNILQNIKSNLQPNNPNLLNNINKLYQFKHQNFTKTDLDFASQQYLSKNKDWVLGFLDKYEQVKNQPNWNALIADYLGKLQFQQMKDQKFYQGNFDNMKVNSERAINKPRRQQDFNEFRKAVNAHSPNLSQFQSRSIQQQLTIPQMIGNEKNMRGRDQLHIVKKNIPNFEFSPTKTVFQYDPSSLLIQPLHKYFKTETKNLQRSAINRTMKLSDFSNQKDMRKKRISEQQLDRAPQWLIIPYYNFFNNYKLYSRYRKNSIFPYSTILEDQKIIVNCYKNRISSVALQFRIEYQNYSSSPIHLKACYKIAHQTFQVKCSEKVKSIFTLREKQSHKFTLIIKQLPLKICSLELSYGNNSFDIPLPFTIINFVRSDFISKQQFFQQWNYSNRRTNYSLSTKICYNRNILISQQIHLLFENCVDLGKTENYSCEQYGLKLNFQYYDLEFLLIFAFNIDTYLSLQMISCQQIDSERAEVLNYYMKVLIMLLQNIKQ